MFSFNSVSKYNALRDADIEDLYGREYMKYRSNANIVYNLANKNSSRIAPEVYDLIIDYKLQDPLNPTADIRKIESAVNYKPFSKAIKRFVMSINLYVSTEINTVFESELKLLEDTVKMPITEGLDYINERISKIVYTSIEALRTLKKVYDDVIEKYKLLKTQSEESKVKNNIMNISIHNIPGVPHSLAESTLVPQMHAEQFGGGKRPNPMSIGWNPYLNWANSLTGHYATNGWL